MLLNRKCNPLNDKSKTCLHIYDALSLLFHLSWFYLNDKFNESPGAEACASKSQRKSSRHLLKSESTFRNHNGVLLSDLTFKVLESLLFIVMPGQLADNSRFKCILNILHSVYIC